MRRILWVVILRFLYLIDLIHMVRPERFELPAFWFVARRSIQLSYGRTLRSLQSSLQNLRQIIRVSAVMQSVRRLRVPAEAEESTAALRRSPDPRGAPVGSPWRRSSGWRRTPRAACGRRGRSLAGGCRTHPVYWPARRSQAQWAAGHSERGFPPWS